MSRSDNPDHYFQTSESLATSARRAAKSKNKKGDPIELKAKVLAALSDHQHGIFVACADGLARSVNLDSRKTSNLNPGANAPLTSLAIGKSSDGQPLLFAGCWDKSIRSWSIKDDRPWKRFHQGHTDFVKCLVFAVVAGQPLLVTGGADAKIIVWNADTGSKLHTLTGHARSVLDLAIDPTSPRSGAGYEHVDLFSADSVRDIRRWRISKETASQLLAKPITAHETSVNKLNFEPADGTEEDSDLWTASADKTAKHLVRSRGWESDTTLEHPDYVKDVLVAGAQGQLVVTACRDEEVRVWDASSGKLLCIYSGHYDEVTGLALVDGGKRLISTSLDGTLRQWSLDMQDMQKAMEERNQAEEPAEDDKKEGMMTADEEAELAELMDSD
ncbi:WD domain-containing protein 34 [Elsinoe australis]|uniref:WD domain-containing protein 34 n=1 Tax=Elsinoe australis TaxID=40998 RepID=A0A4U7AWW9_9PEZI|nr:WD domain-containing protein 34 [Elsinoe australis]